LECRGPRRGSEGRRQLRNDGKTQHPIRIAGIDAPERRQPYANASKDRLSGLVFNRNVEARCYKRDRYGRNVCRVFGDKGQDVGLEMVRAGMAWWYREYAKEQTPVEQGAYQGTEDAARVTRRGLWQEAKPVPPWEWRKPPAR
jgi:endonuclease YncB( thermonuclease family)